MLRPCRYIRRSASVSFQRSASEGSVRKFMPYPTPSLFGFGTWRSRGRQAWSEKLGCNYSQALPSLPVVTPGPTRRLLRHIPSSSRAKLRILQLLQVLQLLQPLLLLWPAIAMARKDAPGPMTTEMKAAASSTRRAWLVLWLKWLSFRKVGSQLAQPWP